MPKTAVGLFENPILVDEVVHDLLASGFHQNDVPHSGRAAGDGRQRGYEHSAHRFRSGLDS